jgi:hypothetical protein
MAANSSTYDHRILKAMLPVRSAIFKQDTGGLVVRWVTTGEYPLMYVFAILYFFHEKKYDFPGCRVKEMCLLIL